MSEEQSLKQKTAKGLFWGGLNSSIQQLLGLLFGIVLGRLLDRSDYGMIGMLAIFPAIASALQESGLVAALANREKVSDKDYNAVFWFSISCGATLYVLLYLSAPLIADFYDTPELTSLARFSFLSFFIASFGIAPRAILFRNLKVKENTIISLSSLFVSGMVAIILAANGFAYWGIAIQTMVFVLIGTMLNWYFAHWKPSFRIDFSPIKEMFGFSSKMLITQIFIIINQNLFSVLLGKFYTKQEVGDFSQANNWNNKGHALITGMINGVTQPVLASVANDPQRQAAVFHKMLRFTAFISPRHVRAQPYCQRIYSDYHHGQMARFRPDHAAALYMGSFYPGQQSVLFITGQPRTFFRLHVQQYRTKRTATDHCLHQLSLWHHYHDLSVCRYQYPVDVRLVPLCPKGNSADPVEHTERYRSVLSAGSFADHRRPLHYAGHHQPVSVTCHQSCFRGFSIRTCFVENAISHFQ